MLLLLLAVLLGLGVTTASAQDPVKLVPADYNVEIEKDWVRVVRSKRGPHAKAPMHEHPAHVVVFLTDVHQRVTGTDGKVQEIRQKAGEVAWGDPVRHAEENLSDRPLEAVVTVDRLPASGGDILITPLIHSSVQIEHAGKVVHVDPWSAGDLSSAKPADLILVTDDVGHHLDVKAIQKLRKPGAPVVMAANGKSQVPDGVVLANGESTTAAGIRVEAIAAYDIKPGEPSHPKGEANGYVITLGGKRIYFAGVTECVPEVQAVKDVEVAFVPMNIPLERMTPAAAAACVKTFKPRVVYVYHYDQDYAARAANPRATSQGLPGGMSIEQSLEAFKNALKGEAIEVRVREWYPARGQ